MDQVPTEPSQAAMTPSPPNDELETLLERLCVGGLDPVGWRRIGELIKGDRAAAKRYAAAIHYCEALREETGGAALPPSADNGNASSAVPGPAPDLPTARTPSADLTTSERTDKSTRWHWLPLWGIAVGLAFLAGWMAPGFKPADSGPTVNAAGAGPEFESLANRDPASNDGTPSSAVANRAAKDEPLAHDPTVATAEIGLPTVDDDWLPAAGPAPLMRITALTPDASAEGLIRSMPVGGQLRRGEVVQLTIGVARLSLADGEVLVEGPAEFSAIDPQTVFVRRGQVTATSEARIAIHTPLAMVTCDGGSVGVVSEAEDQLDVCSIAGEATVYRRPRRGDLAQRLGVVQQGRTLSVSIDADRTATVAEGSKLPAGLLASWDETTSRLHPYEQTVLSDDPMAYWPLNRIRRHRAVLDLTQHGFDGHAIGAWPTELPAALPTGSLKQKGTTSRGSYFNGESYVESYRKPPVDLRSGFTIESWARVLSEPEYQALFASRWVLESNTEREQCFGFTLYAGQNGKWQFWTGSGAYGANWDQLHADAAIAVGRWTHVVATFEPDAIQDAPLRQVAGQAQLYVDGRLVGSEAHTLSLEDFEWPARIGAAEFVPKSLTSWLFRGELRDVALYDHVLSTDRIQTHTERGRTES
ncbi:MAG: LamG-like jellyroll fold domain-containing protein [Planctomycetota bacterium]